MSDRSHSLSELFVREMNALLAHDLRNGFATVEANLMLLDQDRDQLSADAREAVDGIRAALRRMATLAGNLTDIDFLERGELEPHPEPVNVATIARSAVDIHAPTVTPFGVTVDVRAPDRLTATVDPVLFERLLHNLLNSVCRYVPDHGAVRVSLSDRDGQLVVEVGNDGPAVAPEVASALFEPAYGGRKRGRGLGLYFCRLACEAHGGSIALEPDAELSVRFVARLPAQNG